MLHVATSAPQDCVPSLLLSLSVKLRKHMDSSCLPMPHSQQMPGSSGPSTVKTDKTSPGSQRAPESDCACSEAVALQPCRRKKSCRRQGQDHNACSQAHMKTTGRSCTALIWALVGQLGPILRQWAEEFSDVSAGLELWAGTT